MLAFDKSLCYNIKMYTYIKASKTQTLERNPPWPNILKKQIN